jgi:hypothetical protein
VVFYIDILQQQRPGSHLSGEKKKQNQSKSTGLLFILFMFKTPFFIQTFYALLSLLKIENVCVYFFRTGSDTPQISTDLDSASQTKWNLC